jgi:hypothetical protein
MHSSSANQGGHSRLARAVGGAIASEHGPGDFLDRLPETPDGVPEVSLSEATIASLVEAAQFLRSTTEAERFAAPELAARLERHPETRARMLIDNQARYRTWGLAEELIARSRDAIFAGDPPRGVRLARLAASIADHLDVSLYGASLRADLRARAWANLGNSYRCASQLRASAAALRHADDLLLDGTGDPLEAANLLSLRASLATLMGDHLASEELIDRCLTIYEELDEQQLLATALVKRSAALGFRDPAAAAEAAHRAETLIDRKENARLFWMARHNRVFWLIEGGKADEAARLHAASRALFRGFDDPWFSIHLAWNEARLAFALGDAADAETKFQCLLNDLLEHGHQLDAALCALDLAVCRIVRGDTRGASELAGAMAHHLRDWGAHARAREAWALLQHSLSLERATEELARELSAYLRRAWKNPRLAFRPAP